MEILPGETSEIKRFESNSLLRGFYSLQGKSDSHTVCDEHFAEGMTKKQLQAYAFYADAMKKCVCVRANYVCCLCAYVNYVCELSD